MHCYPTREKPFLNIERKDQEALMRKNYTKNNNLRNIREET